MITAFWGELFQYPIPLELSHSYCSNKCAYCFAKLNNPNRKAEVAKVANQLKNYHHKKDMISLLMQNKQAVCVSNKTDPFAQSNYLIAVPQIDTLLELDIPVSFHTRGGKRFDEFYSKRNIKKTLFYISICHTDDSIRKKIEPGATEIAYRWEMVKMLIDDGHQVVVGLNPFVQEWVNCDSYLKSLIHSGVKNVVIQPLHLNSEQLKNMSEKEQAAMSEKIITNAKKRDSPYEYAVKQFVNTLISNGINAFDTQNFNETNIMDCWHKGLPGATFKTYYDFYHWCLKNKEDNEAVFFDEFYNFIKPEAFIESEKYPIYQYITSVDRRYRKTNQSGKSIDRLLTFRELCELIWNDESSTKSLNRVSQFAIFGEINTEKQMVLEAEENGNLIYVFNRNGFEYSLTKNVKKYD